MGGLIIDHPRFLPADHLSAFALCYYPLSSSKWNYFLPDEILLGNSGAGSATQITRLLKLCNLEQIHRMGWLGRDLKARPVPPPAMSREPCTAPGTSGKLSWLLPDLHPFFFQPEFHQELSSRLGVLARGFSMLLKFLSDFSQPGRNLINYFLGSPWNQRERRRKYLTKRRKPSGFTVITKINILKKKPDSVFKVMERESSVREQMEKQICEIQMNSLLAESALKDSGLLIDAELAEGKKNP